MSKFPDMRIIALLFVAFSFSATAQTASNFNIDDIDGVNRDLFDELDDNKIVVLKFFTNWCSICNNTADEVVAIYNDYQNNGDPVVFWALDRDQNETNAHATTYRNNNSIPFPVIGEAYSVAQQFGVVYQPEYYIVRPDRSYAKKTNYSSMQTEVDAALAALFTGVDDVSALNNITISHDQITWNVPASESGTLVVSDMAGRMVYKSSISGQQPVELSNLPTGVYIYTLRTAGDLISTGKLGIAR